MNDDCESLKIKSTVYGNEEIKPRIFNTERKKKVLKITQQNLILKHGRN